MLNTILLEQQNPGNNPNAHHQVVVRVNCGSFIQRDAVQRKHKWTPPIKHQGNQCFSKLLLRPTRQHHLQVFNDASSSPQTHRVRNWGGGWGAAPRASNMTGWISQTPVWEPLLWTNVNTWARKASLRRIQKCGSDLLKSQKLASQNNSSKVPKNTVKH